MVLADTAMTVSATTIVYPRSEQGRPISHGLKRPLAYQGQDGAEFSSFSGASTEGPTKGKESKAKKMKTETPKSKAKSAAGESTRAEPKVKKAVKSKANNADQIGRAHV